MGCPQSHERISCPQCGENNFDDGEEFVTHLQDEHKLGTAVTSCCEQCGGTVTLRTLRCPLCDGEVKDENDLLGHLQAVHGYEQMTKAVASPLAADTVLPCVGDKVLAMWSVSKWQYFHATIVRFISDSLMYEIDWDDGDTTGRFVPYYNLALDKIPDESEIGIGSTILFPQGSYKAGVTQQTGGQRWHQGRITNIYIEDGVKYYDGCHTKGTEDGKIVTYKDYEYSFYRRTREDFRVGPNVFNIINEDDDTDNKEEDLKDIDIYFSCSKPNTTSMYYPKDLTRKLTNLGLKVVEANENDVKKRANMMKNSKVIIACIDTKYVEDEHCKMEFQFAKSTLRKPVVPLIVGEDMSWNMSVVGMLIAGELYIHFKDESVEEPKIEELVKSLSHHISTLSTVVETCLNEEAANTPPKIGPSDVFISYCWWNSWDAKENNQITEVTGTQFSDPRSISRELFTRGYNTWLDTERLKSADANAGLYEQLTEALKDTKLVVPCISDEYASSVNCQMEFKFAVKSLRKQVIPVVVGTGDKWKETVIGALLASFNIEPIVFQLSEDQETFESKLNCLIDRIKAVLTVEDDKKEDEEIELGEGEEVREVTKPAPVVHCSSVPVVGDHVISHHFRWTYYMATVVSFNRETMEYTVAWDDGDKSGTVQPFNQVAKDFEPAQDEIGVGTVIFFPQGSYGGTEGSNEGGIRYHEGVITSITRSEEIIISGHHTHTEEDGKRVMYRNYSHEFFDIPISLIRLAPTALESFGM